jgi:hypothetical protein
MGGALVWALVVLAQNPSWPATTPELPPDALARPESMPGDPDYAPREDPARGCRGQLELYAFTPACTPRISPEERPLGSGVGVDRAWLLTRGSARTTIALIGGGVDWGDRELAGRWRLDPGELPAPRVGGVDTEHDRNGDGTLTPLDYTSATGTTAPSRALIVDDRLRARADGGDTNGNGLLDPADLRVVFGNGRDDDGDGLVDEVSGWDLVDDDADPSAPGALGAAHTAAAETNNGLGGAGACPRCTVLPIRVSTADGARGEHYADGIAWAARQGARVVLVTEPPDYGTSALDAAVREATLRGALVVVPAGDRGGLARQVAFARTPALVVSALAHDVYDRRLATTARAPHPRSSLAVERGLTAPGDDDVQAAALVAGVAALVVSAAEGAAGAPPLVPALAPGELVQVLESTADRAGTGWTVARAAGRLDARAAVEAVLARELPPVVELSSPAAGTVADPTPGVPLVVEGRVSSTRGDTLEWTLESAVGIGPRPEAYAALARGSGTDPVRGLLRLSGVFRDPTAPPGPSQAFAVTLRLSATRRIGARVLRARAERVLWIHHDLLALPSFPRAVGGPLAAAPRAHDVDGDGRDEVLVATTDGALAWFGAAGELRAGWPFLAPLRTPRGPAGPSARSAFATTPAVAALIAGEAASIIALTEDGELWALDAAGQVRPGFPARVAASRGRYHAPAVADLDGDGRSELIITATDGVLDVLDTSGQRRVGFPVAGEGPLSAPAVAARVGLVMVRDGALEVWSPDGQRRSTRPLGEPSRATGARRDPPLGPVLGKGAVVYAAALGRGEVVLGDGPAATLAAGSVGAQSGAPVSLGALTLRAGALAVVDLDVDGRLDLLAPAEAAPDTPLIGAWSGRDGSSLPGFPVEARLRSPAGFIVLDLDGDRRPEAVFADDHLRLMAVSADGLSPRAWPKLVAAPVAGVVAGELLGDDRWVLVAATTEGQLHAWRTEGPSARGPDWSGPGRDPAGTADLEVELAGRRDSQPTSSCTSTPGPAGLLAAWLALVGWWALARARRA